MRPQQRYARRAACHATASRTDALRDLLKQPGIHQGPCCHDALSAKLIEAAGFPFAFMSGFCTAAAAAGLPDTGLISYAEMAAAGRAMHEATARIPIIGDGDTGYGNAVNVKRTVRGYAAAGFAGILIEDQVAPKSCGHVRNKFVVPRDEAVARIRAACDARDAGADILIIARTDARQAVSLEEALARVQAFAEAGADVLFIDALESEEEMRAFTSLRGVASGTPKMASLLEGGGKTPLVPRQALQLMGFKLVAYPLSVLGASIKAMQAALEGLKEDRIPDTDTMPSFAELQDVLGFNAYFAEADRYATAPALAPPGPAAPTTGTAAEVGGPTEVGPTGEPPDGARGSGDFPANLGSKKSGGEAGGGSPASTPGDASAAAARPAAVPSDAGAVLEEDGGGQRMAGSSGAAAQGGTAASAPSTVTTAVLMRRGRGEGGVSDDDGAFRDRASDGYGRQRLDFSRMTLLVRISDKASGAVKLETRLPAGFMAPIAAAVPQLSGVDLQALVRRLSGRGDWTAEAPIFETVEGPDRVQVWLEK